LIIFCFVFETDCSNWSTRISSTWSKSSAGRRNFIWSLNIATSPSSMSWKNIPEGNIV
jgi:hypothetical protein